MVITIADTNLHYPLYWMFSVYSCHWMDQIKVFFSFSSLFKVLLEDLELNSKGYLTVLFVSLFRLRDAYWYLFSYWLSYFYIWFIGISLLFIVGCSTAIDSSIYYCLYEKWCWKKSLKSGQKADEFHKLQLPLHILISISTLAMFRLRQPFVLPPCCISPFSALSHLLNLSTRSLATGIPVCTYTR